MLFFLSLKGWRFPAQLIDNPDRAASLMSHRFFHFVVTSDSISIKYFLLLWRIDKSYFPQFRFVVLEGTLMWVIAFVVKWTCCRTQQTVTYQWELLDLLALSLRIPNAKKNLKCVLQWLQTKLNIRYLWLKSFFCCGWWWWVDDVLGVSPSTKQSGE